jgi:RNA polymerase sigma-70 factor (ECF subfamily)
MVSGFEAAVERHQRKVYTFARYYLGNPEEAEDVTQEVLVRMWRQWRKLDAERLGPWLLRVTRNACYDLLRRRRSAAKLVVPEPEVEGLEQAAVETAAAGDPDPQARAEAADFRRHLRSALGELGEPMKSIVILREIQGFKYREISDALDLPLNTVRVYLHRGRRRLRERLREVYGHAATA